MVWCFTGIAFLVGAWTGRRTQVLVITGVIAVAGYIMRAIASMVDSLSWWKRLSPFHYYIGDDPLRTGGHLDQILVLVAVGAVTAIAGIVAFDRRDVGR